MLAEGIRGLGIPDLAARSIALRCRWLWQSWMSTNKPWAGLPLPIDDKVRALFEASVQFSIGNGAATQFWTDPWHEVGKFSLTFPDLFKHCTLRRITIKTAMTDDKWVRHFKADLSGPAVIQFTQLWTLLLDVQLLHDEPDSLRWKWTANGIYSAQSAYEAQFIGTIRPSFPELIWHADAPPKCRFFSWLAVQGRCQTADNLARKGWPHNPLCALCGTQPETTVHLLATCSYSLRFWQIAIDRARLPPNLTPTAATTSLTEWLQCTSSSLNQDMAKTWQSIVPLIWWSLWLERNGRIFNHKMSSPAQLLQTTLAEARDWVNAGRRRVLALVDRPLEPD